MILRTASSKADCLSLSKLGEKSLSYDDWKYEVKSKFVQILSEGKKDVGYVSIDWGTDVYVENDAIVCDANVPQSFFSSNFLQKFAKQTKQALKTHLIEVMGPHEVAEPILVWLVDETKTDKLKTFKEAGWKAIPTKSGEYLLEGVESENDLVLMSC